MQCTVNYICVKEAIEKQPDPGQTYALGSNQDKRGQEGGIVGSYKNVCSMLVALPMVYSAMGSWNTLGVAHQHWWALHPAILATT